MRASRAAVMLIVLVACETGEPARPERRAPREIESGGRLLARTWIVGRHEVFREFVDRAIGAPCSFTENVGPGPTYRCLPKRSAKHLEGQGPYLDPTCTTPVGLVSENVAGAYVIVEQPNACQKERVVHLAGEVETRLAYAFDGPDCVPLSSTRVRVQRLVSAIPDAFFVRAQPIEVDRGGRIASLALVGEDGSRQPFEAFDRERGQPVIADVAEDGMQRWRPSRVAFVGAGAPVFADEACTTQVATKIARDAACPLSSALVFEGVCGRHVVHDLGAPVLALRAPDETGKCGPSASSSLAFAIGPRIPPEVLAPATRIEIEGGPVRRRGFTGPNGALALGADLVDVRTNELCEVFLATDGKNRCLPKLTAPPGYFSDEACTLTAARFTPTGCETEPLPTLLHIEESGTSRALAIGEPVDRLFTQEKGRCRAVALNPIETAYALTEVDVGLFPEAKEREAD